jgi:hypothetical protein
MDFILIGAGCFVLGLLVAAWRLRGEDGIVATLRKLGGGGPGPRK